MQDLEAMYLERPLRLKQIRTYSTQAFGLLAMQLFFEDGIESPMINLKHQDNVFNVCDIRQEA